jgi:hypothetical protein
MNRFVLAFLGLAPSALAASVPVPVPPEVDDEYGLVDVWAQTDTSRSQCSGTLLRNDWVLTSSHCIPYGSPHVSVSGTLSPVLVSGYTQIARLDPVDLALVHLPEPFEVHGATSGFEQPLQDAVGVAVATIDVFAMIPTTHTNWTGYGVQTGIVTSDAGDTFDYWVGTGPMAGGGSFTDEWGRPLTGVHTGDCTATPFYGLLTCTDVAVAPVAQQLRDIMDNPTPPTPPYEFPGTFDTTPIPAPVHVYAIGPTGGLVWNEWDGATWAVPQFVGTGWGFAHVVPAGGNEIFTVSADGELSWYRHDGVYQGTTEWTGPVPITGGFDHPIVFGGGDGVIYAVDDQGDLLWYRYDGFALTEPSVIGTGWDEFATVVSTGDGAIYGMLPDGDLWLYHHDGFATGAASWSGIRRVAGGWDTFERIVPVEDSVLLGIEPDGTVWWYRDLGLVTGTAFFPYEAWDGPLRINDGFAGLAGAFALLPNPPAPVN